MDDAEECSIPDGKELILRNATEYGILSSGEYENEFHYRAIAIAVGRGYAGRDIERVWRATR
jgi:hypothetical protein